MASASTCSPSCESSLQLDIASPELKTGKVETQETAKEKADAQKGAWL